MNDENGTEALAGEILFNCAAAAGITRAAAWPTLSLEVRCAWEEAAARFRVWLATEPEARQRPV